LACTFEVLRQGHLDGPPYLRSRTAIATLDVTPYEARNKRPPELGHLKRFGQVGLCQIRKIGGVNWEKGKERVERGRLVGYEGDHIFRMVMSNGSVQRYSHIKWIEQTKRPAPDVLPRGQLFPTTAVKHSVPRQGDSIMARQKMPRIEELEDDSSDQVTDSLKTIPLPSDSRQQQPAEKQASLQPTKPTGEQRLLQISGPSIVEHQQSSPETLTPNTEPGDPLDSDEHASLRELTPALEDDSNNIYQDNIFPGRPEPAEPVKSPEPLALLSKARPIDVHEPKTYKAAMADQYHKMEWELAMSDEIDSLLKSDTWVLVDVPKGQKHTVIGGKWVFKLKRGVDNDITRYKARWVVRGFQQREESFEETFASVVKPMSYKAIFAIAVAYDLEIEQMDVKTAFLYGMVKNDVYVSQPEGFTDGTRKVCKLRKALYGLKQSPRVWYDTFAEYLKVLGFVPLSTDFSVFINHKTNIIIALYVDDLLIVGPSKADIAALKLQLHQKFQMTDLGPCCYYLGMAVQRDRPNRVLTLSQENYRQRVLEDHNMWVDSAKTKPHATPMESGHFLPAEEGFQATAEARLAYQSGVGSLMYAMLGTRPDIAFAVSVVSRYASNPDSTHEKALKRIFRYLRGTIALKLTYQGALSELSGYTDADWAGDHGTRRSTSGYVFSLGSAAISWSSKRQTTVALSTCEAEYMGQTQAVKEAIWLERLLNDLAPMRVNKRSLKRTINAKAPPKIVDNPPDIALISCSGMNNSFDETFALLTVIYADNQGAIALARNPTQHGKSKHIATQWHFTREAVANGQVELEYTPTEQMVADGLTKALTREGFERFRKALGLQ